MDAGQKKTPLRAIKEKCLDCCCGSYIEVKLCPVEGCPLFPFRFGKNSLIKREYSEEQKERMRDNLDKAREIRAANIDAAKKTT